MTSTQPRPIRVVEASAPDAPAGQPSVVTAAGEVHYPLKPPAEWFADPQLDGPTQLRITEDGQFWVTWLLLAFATLACRKCDGAPVEDGLPSIQDRHDDLRWW